MFPLNLNMKCSMRAWVGLCAAFLAVEVSAQIQVEGTGWWSDRALQRALAELAATDQRDVITANVVEDAVFFVMSSVVDEGYLRPEVEATIERDTGENVVHRFDVDFMDLLPRPLQGRHVTLTVKPGVRYKFGELNLRGTESIWGEAQVRGLMIPRTGILARSADAVYTPAKLRRGLEQVRLELDRAGYAENDVHVEAERKNPTTGQVDVDIVINPGPRWRGEAVRVEGGAEIAVRAFKPDAFKNMIWTAAVEQDLVEQFRRAYYQSGYPDVRVTTRREMRESAGAERLVEVVLEVNAGEKVTMGAARFSGTDAVKLAVLARRIELKRGDLLNPIEVEEARRRLQRLRALRRVRVDYDPATGSERAPVFDLEAREPWEVSLLGGFGSYEQVRAGVELKGNNLFSRSHQFRVEGIASMKSLRGEMVYTVPEIFGEAVDGNVRLFGLDREELSFQRREYGGSFGVSRRSLPWINAEGLVSYTFQELANERNELATRQTDDDAASTASLTLGLRRDRRDNPLLPRKGQRWTAQVEIADQSLGGSSAFQRIELGWSWHKPLTDSSWLHFGVAHGTILTLGEPDDQGLPMNKRFFPGGENSYRGLQAGAAVTRDTTGDLTGAKSFSMLNLEYELALTQRISAVLFWDALGVTAKVAEFPWEDTLHAVGGGVRYNTVIGPVRLEYGHNVNRRVGDPSGRVHFSIGYPF